MLDVLYARYRSRKIHPYPMQTGSLDACRVLDPVMFVLIMNRWIIMRVCSVYNYSIYIYIWYIYIYIYQYIYIYIYIYITRGSYNPSRLCLGNRVNRMPTTVRSETGTVSRTTMARDRNIWTVVLRSRQVSHLQYYSHEFRHHGTTCKLRRRSWKWTGLWVRFLADPTD